MYSQFRFGSGLLAAALAAIVATPAHAGGDTHGDAPPPTAPPEDHSHNRDDLALPEPPPPTPPSHDGLHLVIALDGSFPVMHADRGAWIYPTAGLLITGRHARLDVRSMAPFAIGDGLVGAVRYLATGRSELPPLMGALNPHDDGPVAIPAIAATLDGRIPRDDGAHWLLGGEYRLVLAGRPFEADLSGPDEPPPSMDTERTLSLLLNQVALRGGLSVDARGTRVHTTAFAGNGFGTLSLWNPLLGLEFAVHTPARGWAGFHARLRGQVQQVGYAGYEPVNPTHAPFWDTDVREWTRTLSLELGMTVRLGR